MRSGCFTTCNAWPGQPSAQCPPKGSRASSNSGSSHASRCAALCWLMAQRSGNLFRWDDLPCCEARGTKGHAVPVDYTPAKHRQPIHHSTQFGGAQTQAAQASVERVGGRSEALSDFPCAQHIWPDSVTGHRQCRSQPTLLSGTRATATAVVSKGVAAREAGGERAFHGAVLRAGACDEVRASAAGQPGSCPPGHTSLPPAAPRSPSNNAARVAVLGASAVRSSQPQACVTRAVQARLSLV